MRTAVVSGGGTGIGAATARVLAEDGYDVVIVGRRLDVLTATAAEVSTSVSRPEAVRAVAADLTRPDDVARVVAALPAGGVDVLVNNAGGYRAGHGDTLAGVAEHWRANFDANVLTAVLLTEALFDRLTRPGATVVLLSSIAAQRGGGGPYSAAKAALHGWLFDLARALGPDGVTANVISPGYVAETEFFGDRMTPEGHADRGPDPRGPRRHPDRHRRRRPLSGPRTLRDRAGHRRQRRLRAGPLTCSRHRRTCPSTSW
jgi:3-oxoacyl-[acyl-carrier protein] reductase